MLDEFFPFSQAIFLKQMKNPIGKFQTDFS
jgi:hypothetical protein